MLLSCHNSVTFFPSKVKHAKGTPPAKKLPGTANKNGPKLVRKDPSSDSSDSDSDGSSDSSSEEENVRIVTSSLIDNDLDVVNFMLTFLMSR